MKSRMAVVIGVFALMVGIGASRLSAQHNHAASQGTTTDAMQECQKHWSEAAGLVDQISKTLADGKERNDPAEIRAAIDKAQSQLEEMRQHLSACPMAKGDVTHHSHEHMQKMNCMSDQPAADKKDETPQ